MNLSKRLQSIANFVKQDSTVCDIGTDHGYIPVYLVKENISKKVIGSDISRGSLDKIIDLIKRENVEDYIEARLGDGLDILNDNEADTLIIAGMGGLLISEILEKGKDISGIEHFILQPMVGAKELRKYLEKNNFKIISEDLVCEDRKYYEVISALRGKQEIGKKIYYEISEKLINNRHPLLKSFVEYKKNKVKNIINEIKSIDTDRTKDRYNEMQRLLDQYQEVLNEIESQRNNETHG